MFGDTDFSVFNNPADHLGGSASLAIVESDGEIVGRLSFWDIVLSDMHRSGRLNVDTVIDTRNSDGDFFKGKVFARGETATEGEHA